MLVNRKENWEIYQEPATPATKPAVRVNTAKKSNCMLFIGVVAILSMLVTLQSAIIVKAGYELVQVKAQVVQKEKANDSLRLDIAKLKSPQRIQQIAMQDLGMVVPKTVYHATVMPVGSDNTAKNTVAAGKKDGLFSFNQAGAAGGR